MVSGTKNPDKVRAGLASARKRWGDTPKTVKLDDLSTPQRRLVLALVDAARAQRDESPEAA